MSASKGVIDSSVASSSVAKKSAITKSATVKTYSPGIVGNYGSAPTSPFISPKIQSQNSITTPQTTSPEPSIFSWFSSKTSTVQAPITTKKIISTKTVTTKSGASIKGKAATSKALGIGKSSTFPIMSSKAAESKTALTAQQSAEQSAVAAKKSAAAAKKSAAIAKKSAAAAAKSAKTGSAKTNISEPSFFSWFSSKPATIKSSSTKTSIATTKGLSAKSGATKSAVSKSSTFPIMSSKAAKTKSAIKAQKAATAKTQASEPSLFSWFSTKSFSSKSTSVSKASTAKIGTAKTPITTKKIATKKMLSAKTGATKSAASKSSTFPIMSSKAAKTKSAIKAQKAATAKAQASEPSLFSWFSSKSFSSKSFSSKSLSSKPATAKSSTSTLTTTKSGTTKPTIATKKTLSTKAGATKSATSQLAPQKAGSKIGSTKLSSSKLSSSGLGQPGLITKSGAAIATATQQSIDSLIATQIKTSSASYTMISGNTLPLLLKGSIGSSAIIAGTGIVPFMLPAILAGLAMGELFAKSQNNKTTKQAKNKKSTVTTDSDKENAASPVKSKLEQSSPGKEKPPLGITQEKSIPKNRSISTIFNRLLKDNEETEPKERRILKTEKTTEQSKSERSKSERSKSEQPKSEQQLFHQLLEHTFRTNHLTNDRRRSPRIPVPPNVIKVIWEDSDSKKFTGSVINISLNGILFDAAAGNEKDEEINNNNFENTHIKSISFSWEDELLTIKDPIIVWSKGNYVAITFDKD